MDCIVGVLCVINLISSVHKFHRPDSPIKSSDIWVSCFYLTSRKRSSPLLQIVLRSKDIIYVCIYLFILISSLCLCSDMNNSNVHIIGIALCTLGNISSTERSRDLCSEVEKLLNSSNAFVRKKV